jgi:hypothetical protein
MSGMPRWLGSQMTLNFTLVPMTEHDRTLGLPAFPHALAHGFPLFFVMLHQYQVKVFIV